MNDAELTWLAEKAQQYTSILEVGSWRGRSTRGLADNTNGTIHAVDLWESGPANWMDSITYTKAMFQPRPVDYAYEEFLANLSPHIDNGKVIPIRSSSLSAAAALHRQFDFIFIDASHDVDSVIADIRAWRPRLAPDGLLAGHDYSDNWPGVMEAVDSLIPDRKIASETSIWYI